MTFAKFRSFVTKCFLTSFMLFAKMTINVHLINLPY